MKKQVYLFGAGELAGQALPAILEKYDVVGFFDNDPHKWGGIFHEGIPIYSAQDLNMENLSIIIVSMFYLQIYKQLMDLGVKDIQVYPTSVLTPITGPNESVCKKSDAAVFSLYRKLWHLDTDKAFKSENVRQFCMQKDYYIWYNYALVLNQILNENESPASLLDCGGGKGILALLAIEYGLPQVCYNSENQQDIEDFNELANILGCFGYEIYIGNVSNCIKHYTKQQVRFDAICHRNFHSVTQETCLANAYSFEEICNREKGVLCRVCDQCL